MLPFAPITRFTDWFASNEAQRFVKKMIPSRVGLAAAKVARREIGKGEFGGNNRGKDLDRYRGPNNKGKGAWCAAFVGYCLSVGAEGTGLPLKFKRTNGARRLFNRAVASGGWLVDYQDIQPGDLVLWARGSQGWQAHIAFVSRVERDSAGKVTGFSRIAGNEGVYPALVSEVHQSERKKRRIGFARVS